MDEVQLKYQYAERELAMAARTGQQADIDRISKNKADLDTRYKNAVAEMQTSGRRDPVQGRLAPGRDGRQRS